MGSRIPEVARRTATTLGGGSWGRTLLVGLTLLAVVLGGWILRVRGIEHHLPQWVYSDGYVLLQMAAYLRGEIELEEARRFFGYYPMLPALAVSIWPPAEASLSGSDPLEQMLALAAAPWTHVRRVSAVLSLGAVLAAYGLARRFSGVGGALLAAALTATSLLHVTFSATQRPHGMLSAASSLGVLTLVWTRRRRGVAPRLLAAAAVAVAASTLQSGMAILPAWFLAWRGRTERGSRARELAVGVASLAIVVLAAVWSYSTVVAPAPGSGSPAGLGPLALLGSHAIDWSTSPGRGALVLGRAFALYDPVLGLGALVGALSLLTPAGRRWLSADPQRRLDLWVCLGFVLPYALVFALFGRTLERFALPLIPFAAVVTAAVAVEWARKLGVDRRRPILAAALVLGLLALPVAASWRLGTLRLRPDTITLAARWIQERAPAAGQRVLVSAPNFELPLFYSAAALASLDHAATAYWTDFQRALPPERFAPPRFDVERERLLPDDERARSGWDFDFVVLHSSGARVRPAGFNEDLKLWAEQGVESVVISPFDEPPDARRRASAVRELRWPIQLFGIAEHPELPLLFGAQRLGPRLRVMVRPRPSEPAPR